MKEKESSRIWFYKDLYKDYRVFFSYEYEIIDSE